MIKQDIVSAKKRLSFEITKFVRGEEDAIKAQQASQALFSGMGDLENAPKYELAKQDLPVKLADLLNDSGLVKSKQEARRMCEQGAISLDGEVVKDFGYQITENHFNNGYFILKKGKKGFVKVILK